MVVVHVPLVNPAAPQVDRIIPAQNGKTSVVHKTCGAVAFGIRFVDAMCGKCTISVDVIRGCRSAFELYDGSPDQSGKA